jgi:hypothetical protein
MKPIKNLAAALLLASALSVNVYAGIQETPGAVPPPPTPATLPAEDTDTAEKLQATETQEPTLAEEFWVETLMAMLSLY